MGKQLRLATRGFGADPGIPTIATVTGWVAGHRGRAGDLITLQLKQSLIPQIEAEILVPCAGGRFYRNHLIECFTGFDETKAICEIGVSPERAIEDAWEIVTWKKGAWCGLPAPHALGVSDTYYGDDSEWSEAIFGAYRTLMRSMRDAGIGGHVLLCNCISDREVSALARQKVFFFLPDPEREDLEILMEYQQQIAVDISHVELVLELTNEFEIRRLVILDADDQAITRALSHFDPERICIGGYCIKDCTHYWKLLYESAYYIK